MMPRFWPMFRKEFIQMRRDRLTFAMLIGIPVIQLLVFGYAIQTDVRNLPTVVLDQSRTPESRDLIAAFENTGNFRVVTHVDGRPALDAAIARGDAQAGIVVPYDYPRDLARGTTATVQVIVDAADPLSSQAALNAAVGVAQVRNLAILSRAAGRSLPVEARVRPRYNPGLRSPNYIVPGLVGVILTMTMVLITAMAIVRERARHARAAHRHPYHEDRIDAGEDHSVRGRRPPADDRRADPRPVRVRRPAHGEYPAALRREPHLHHREPGARPVRVHAGADPATSDAGELRLHAPQHPAVGLHVPPPSHAGDRPVARAPGPD